MKIYVDELPKNCKECPLHRSGCLKVKNGGRYIDAETCVLGNFYKFQEIDDEIYTCPLETTQSLKQQVRKEVCNDFKSRFLATCQIEKVCDTASFSLEVLNKILDQLRQV